MDIEFEMERLTLRGVLLDVFLHSELAEPQIPFFLGVVAITGIVFLADPSPINGL